jgi:hypothetical protein
MPLLLFLSKVALICNVFFLLNLLPHHYLLLLPAVVTSAVIILGYVLGFILNVLMVIVFFVLLTSRRILWNQVSAWVIIAINFLFLVFQLMIFFHVLRR